MTTTKPDTLLVDYQTISKREKKDKKKQTFPLYHYTNNQIVLDDAFHAHYNVEDMSSGASQLLL